jgi:hypothetical protein
MELVQGAIQNLKVNNKVANNIQGKLLPAKIPHQAEIYKHMTKIKY